MTTDEQMPEISEPVAQPIAPPDIEPLEFDEPLLIPKKRGVGRPSMSKEQRLVNAELSRQKTNENKAKKRAELKKAKEDAAFEARIQEVQRENAEKDRVITEKAKAELKRREEHAYKVADEEERDRILAENKALNARLKKLEKENELIPLLKEKPPPPLPPSPPPSPPPRAHSPCVFY